MIELWTSLKRSFSVSGPSSCNSRHKFTRSTDFTAISKRRLKLHFLTYILALVCFHFSLYFVDLSIVDAFTIVWLIVSWLHWATVVFSWWRKQHQCMSGTEAMRKVYLVVAWLPLVSAGSEYSMFSSWYRNFCKSCLAWVSCLKLMLRSTGASVLPGTSP